MIMGRREANGEDGRIQAPAKFGAKIYGARPKAASHHIRRDENTRESGRHTDLHGAMPRRKTSQFQPAW